MSSSNKVHDSKPLTGLISEGHLYVRQAALNVGIKLLNFRETFRAWSLAIGVDGQIF